MNIIWFLITVLSASGSFLPSGVVALHPNDLVRAHYFFHQRKTCAFNLFMYPRARDRMSDETDFPRTHHPDFEGPDGLYQLADKIRDLNLYPTAAGLLAAMQAQEGNGFASAPVFVDALEEQGVEATPALNLFRSGFGEHYRTLRASWSQLEEYEALFYLLKFNHLPDFLFTRVFLATALVSSQIQYYPDMLMVHQVPRAQRVYFRYGGFYGLEISATDLREYERQLLELPTLRHLRVVLDLSQWVDVLNSPVIPRLESLSLRLLPTARPSRLASAWAAMTAEPPPSSFPVRRPRRIHRIRTATQNLNSLQIINQSMDASVLASDYLTYFALAAPSRLSLHSLQLDEGLAKLHALFSRVQWFESENCTPPYGNRRPREIWYAFFSQIAPQLEELHLSTSHGMYQGGLNTVPFPKLTRLGLHLRDLVTEDQWNLLENSELIQQLEYLHLNGFAYSAATVPAMTRALRLAARLRELKYSMTLPETQFVLLIQGLPELLLTRFEVGQTRLTHRGLKAIASSAAMQAVTELVFEDALLSESALRSLAQLPKLSKIYVAFQPEKTMSKLVEVLNELRARGIEVIIGYPPSP